MRISGSSRTTWSTRRSGSGLSFVALYFLLLIHFNAYAKSNPRFLRSELEGYLSENEIFTEPKYQVELTYQKNGKSAVEYIRKLTKLHEETADQAIEKKKTISTLLNFHNSQYFGKISVGTPPVTFIVVKWLTTWDNSEIEATNIYQRCLIPGAQVYGYHFQNAKGCDGHQKYAIERSSTFRKLKTKDSSMPVSYMQYGTGACESKHPFNDLPFDGLVGLGFAEIRGQANVPEDALPLIENIKKQKLIKHNVFSVYMSEDPDNLVLRIRSEPHRIFHAFLIEHATSSVVLRYVHFGDNVKWLPVVSVDYWEVALHSIMVGKKKLHICPERGCKAAVDTGSSLVTGPSNVIFPLLDYLGVKPDCSNLHSLPIISIILRDTYGRKVSFPMHPRDYVLEEINSMGRTSECAAGFMPMDVPYPRGPLFVLGNSFIRKYYAIFNRDKMMIGLIEANHSWDKKTKKRAITSAGETHYPMLFIVSIFLLSIMLQLAL